MKTTKVTRNALRKAVNSLKEQMREGNNLLEIDLDDNTKMYAEVFSCDNVRELLDATLLRVAREDVVYNNISDWIYRELEFEVERLNGFASYAEQLNEYQKEYEHIGGQFAYQ